MTNRHTDEGRPGQAALKTTLTAPKSLPQRPRSVEATRWRLPDGRVVKLPDGIIAGRERGYWAYTIDRWPGHAALALAELRMDELNRAPFVHLLDARVVRSGGG